MSADLRTLFDPIAVARSARPQFRLVPAQTTPIATPAYIEVYIDTTQLPAAVLSGGGLDLGGQLALIHAALARASDQRLIHTQATIALPDLTVANVDTAVTVVWDEGTAQTVPVLVAVVPVGPGPVQQRSISVAVTSLTLAGVTAVFRTKLALAGATAPDPDDRYVINALYLFTPPFNLLSSTATDTARANDTAASKRLVRSATDTAGAIDTASVTQVRTAADTAAAADTVSWSPSAKVRAAADTATTADTAAPFTGLVRAGIDTAAASDTVLSFARLARTAADTATTTDAAAAVTGLVRAVDDSAGAYTL